MTGLISRKIVAGSAALIAVILVFVPFHALLTVWAASGLGHYRLIRLWPEFLLLVLAALALVVLLVDRKLWRKLEIRWLFWAILAYFVLTVVLGFLAIAKQQVNFLAFGDGLILNLRFLVFFLVCLIVGARTDWLRRHWRPLVLIPAALVIIFGLLQFFVLPNNVLSHVGYGAGTIRPYETVDHNQQFARLQSTLRGPNPLGAYLVVIVAALAVPLLRKRKFDKRLALEMLGLLAALFVLFYSYSRSAYVGAALTLAGGALLALRSRGARQWVLAGMVVAIILAGGSLLVFRGSPAVQDTFFHTSAASTSQISSNERHLRKLERAGGQVLRQPFGRGTGTAGPASVHNIRPARIADNYYLQIAQETGWLGLALFLIINVLVAIKLWKRRQATLARLLFISLIGISFINLLSHAWTDVTLSLIWWGLAGVALAPEIGTKPSKPSFPRRRESSKKESPRATPKKTGFPIESGMTAIEGYVSSTAIKRLESQNL
jgi:hypothetical protein